MKLNFVDSGMFMITFERIRQNAFVKGVVQPAASANLCRVVSSLSNPNVSSHVTGQMRTLYFLQIINCSFLTQNTFKKYIKNN